MGLLYKLSLLAAVIVLAIAGVVLLADWPVELGEYSIQICGKVAEGDVDGGLVVCEERRFNLLRGSQVSGVLGAAILSLALDLIVVLVSEYFVKRFEVLRRDWVGLMRLKLRLDIHCTAGATVAIPHPEWCA
ncbi:MAG: hypothetical protein QXM16_05555 [Nitrososphaerota archaeon]